MKRMLGVAGVSLVALVIVSVTSSSTLAQADPFLGNWKLNAAKSNYTPGPAPKAQTSTYENTPQGVKVTASGTDDAGKPTSTAYTAKYDGKDYPVTGNADYDTVAIKKVDANTLEFTRKKAGKVVQTGTNVVSKDGKTRTVTAKGTNAKGQQINNVTVYDKQ